MKRSILSAVAAFTTTSAMAVMGVIAQPNDSTDRRAGDKLKGTTVIPKETYPPKPPLVVQRVEPTPDAEVERRKEGARKAREKNAETAERLRKTEQAEKKR